MRYLALITFYLITVSVSNLFRFNTIEIESLQNLRFGLDVVVRSLLEGSGFIMAFIVVFVLFKQPNSKYFYRPVPKELILLAVPLTFYTLLGIESGGTGNSHLTGLIISASIMIYCFLEEMVWRGYLLKELSHLNKYLKYLLIACLWYFWHLSFLAATDFNFLNELQYLLIFIGASFALGTVVEKKGSVYPAVFLHFLINTLSFSQVLEAVPMEYKVGIAIASFIAWFIIDRIFDPKPKAPLKAQGVILEVSIL